ncbi:MAG: tetratricopeptide repeat protein [Acidobacteria bacterium]|nr:MAG: tetratricopeptide repeat protein [Acidobacteriota bacterium]
MSKRPKNPHSLGSLYRPLDGPATLAALVATAASHRGRLAQVTRLLVGVAAGLLVINLVTTGTDSDLPTAQRWWSVFPVLSIGLVLWILFAGQRLLALRALATQRHLLAHRRLADREAEIRGCEAKLAARLESRSPRRLEIEGVLAAARQESARLIDQLVRRTAEDEAAEQLDTDPRPAAAVLEREPLLASLDAYRLALANIELDVLAEKGFLGSPAAAPAFESALSQLKLAPQTPSTAPSAPPRAAVRQSLAVLPFADLSSEQDQEYFATGLAEELIAALTKIGGLRVIARSSALSARANGDDVQEIGRRLGVDTVLEGSVRKSGDRLRITVQLIDVDAGLHLWSERYDRQTGDIFTIQDEITSRVVQHLEASLPAAAPTMLVRPQTENLEAYHLYLRGRHFWAKRTAAALTDGLRSFEQAVELDPGYALAWAGIADSYILLGFYSVLTPEEAFSKAKEAALEALAIDDSLAEGHLSLAFARILYDWDWQGAGQAFQRTFELNPGYATAHHWFAEYLAFQGRHQEAIEQARAALALDPLSLIINVLMGWVLYYARRYDESIVKLEETLELDPEFAPAEFWLGQAYEQQGRFEQAIAAFERAVESSGRSPMMLAALGRVFADQGRSDRASELLEELERTAEKTYVPCYYIAAIHSGSGERELTLEWLERACEQRESWMVFLNIDPIWDGYRSEPRFQALVERVGLPPTRQ